VRVYRDGIIEKLTKDTLAEAITGVIELIADDTIQINWNNNISSKYKQVDTIH